MSPISYQLGFQPIKDHVFLSDKQTLAITKGNEVEIYSVQPGNASKHLLVTVLKGHDKTVTSVDISPDGARILTCSQDRNALVWEYDSSAQEFKPTLVLLRIARAATVCKWSPFGDKFAVGSSDRVVAVCYYEAENDWWVSKHLKKPLKSTITSIDWHPNNVLLAAGSTDGHARVFSAYIKGLDSKPEASVWGSKLPFQTLAGDFINETGAWVHGVAFSPLGDALAFVSHDSSVTLVYPAGEGQPPSLILTVRTDHLPFLGVVFVSESKLVAGGHNQTLVAFEGSANDWKESGAVEKVAGGPVKAAVVDEDAEISSHDALNMFRQMDLKGRVNKSRETTTVHHNTISSVKLYGTNQVSTSGLDGKVGIFSV